MVFIKYFFLICFPLFRYKKNQFILYNYHHHVFHFLLIMLYYHNYPITKYLRSKMFKLYLLFLISFYLENSIIVLFVFLILLYFNLLLFSFLSSIIIIIQGLLFCLLFFSIISSNFRYHFKKVMKKVSKFPPNVGKYSVLWTSLDLQRNFCTNGINK